jgi:hypothetical protein
VSIQTLNLRITAIASLRAALACGNDEKHPYVHVLFDLQGNATELFNTDGSGIVFVPIAEHLAAYDDSVEHTPAIKLQLVNVTIPARAREVVLAIAREANGSIAGHAIIDGTKAGFVQVAESGLAHARKIVPVDLPRLPIGHPMGYDAIEVARVLKASGKNAPRYQELVQLPNGFAWQWRFDDGGTFTKVTLRGDDDIEKTFRRILDTTREKAPF